MTAISIATLIQIYGVLACCGAIAAVVIALSWD